VVCPGSGSAVTGGVNDRLSRGAVSGQHRLWRDRRAGARDHGGGDPGRAHEKRNVNWSEARGRWDVASALKKQAQLDELIAFFRGVKGQAYGFRFKDWTDYTADGRLLGTSDGAAQTHFQLIKRYPSGSVIKVRTVSGVASIQLGY
jgi:Conserved hypothetical protein 2217 (DUF2460)